MIVMQEHILIAVISLKNLMLPCLNKKLFGVECPGCGFQRAFLMLIKGDFSEAFHMYPAIYPMLLLVVFLGSNLFLKIKYAFHIKVFLGITTVLTIIVSYILKMNHFIH